MFSLLRRSSARPATAPKARLGLESLDRRDMPAATLASVGTSSIIVIGSSTGSLAKYSAVSIIDDNGAPSGGIIVIGGDPAALFQKV